jgi:hypothetical protein
MKAQQTMSGGTDPNSVRKVVSVQAPQAVAWQVFTEKMGTWWPLANYKIGKANAVDAVCVMISESSLAFTPLSSANAK